MSVRVIVENTCQHRLSVGGCFCDDYKRSVVTPIPPHVNGSHCPFPKKILYGSREEAEWHLDETGGWDILRPYHCQADHWHLTSEGLRLLREDRGVRKWSVAEKVNGATVLSVGSQFRRPISIELTPEDRWELAAALLAAGLFEEDT